MLRIKKITDDRQNAVISLGGYHSVAYPKVCAHFEKYLELNVLHLDTHPDLDGNMQGNHYSHASPFARLIETGQLNRLAQTGTRTLNQHQQGHCTVSTRIHEMQDLSAICALRK